MQKLTLKSLLIIVSAAVVLNGCGSTGATSALSSGSSFLSSLASNPNLSSLTSLLKSPEIGKLLGGVTKKPFTMLAPTNSALEGMGADALANLQKPENASQLAGLLKNQIVPGKLDADALMKGGLKTAGGKPLNLEGVDLGNMMSSDIANIIPVDKLLK